VETSVFVAGDWHGNAEWATNCIELARRLGCRRLIQLGDFGIWNPIGTQRYLDAMEAGCRNGDGEVTVYALGGNHENYDMVAEYEQRPGDDGFVALRPHVQWIPRGHRWTWETRRLGAVGGAFSIDWRRRRIGTSWWPDQEEVQPSDIRTLGTEPLDILCTHDAPMGSQPPSIFDIPIPVQDQAQADESRKLLLEAVHATQPKLLLHGHWHQRNQRILSFAQCSVRIEGLESDQEAGPKSWGILDLATLDFSDGRKFAGYLSTGPGPGKHSTGLAP
jgi:hypothetical protein